jgi:hypothetical protein
VLDEGVVPGQLTAPIHHHSITSWFHMVDKANRFTSHEIGKLATKPRWVLKLRLVSEMPLQFLRNYLLRGHVFGGWKGFVFALNTAYPAHAAHRQSAGGAGAVTRLTHGWYASRRNCQKTVINPRLTPCIHRRGPVHPWLARSIRLLS